MNINNFAPFDVTIWGNVSDYISIIVYSITAYLLWRTFKSQIIVQRLQQEQFNIERYKQRELMKPVFSIRSYGGNPTWNGTHYRCEPIYILTVSKLAYDIKIFVTFKKGTGVFSAFIPPNFSILNEGSEEQFPLDLFIDPLHLPTNPFNAELNILI